MTEISMMDEMIENFTTLIKAPSIEAADKIFYYPAVIMDRVSFIPASSAEEILEFFNNFKSSVLDRLEYKFLECKKIEADDLSGSLKSARVSWEFFSANRVPLFSSTFSLSLICVESEFKVVVLEVNNAPMHQSKNLKVKCMEFNRIASSNINVI